MDTRIHAHFFWRVLASLIDFAIVMVTTVIVSLIVGVLLVVALAFLQLDKNAADLAATLTGYVVGVIVTTAYFAGFECSKLQATPGKMLTGLTVTDMNGKRIGFGRAFVRMILKVISGFLFGFAYLVCLVTENKQAVHDIVVGTLVWKTSPDKEETKNNPDERGKPQGAIE